MVRARLVQRRLSELKRMSDWHGTNCGCLCQARVNRSVAFHRVQFCNVRRLTRTERRWHGEFRRKRWWQTFRSWRGNRKSQNSDATAKQPCMFVSLHQSHASAPYTDLHSLAQGNENNTYIAPRAAYSSCSDAVHVTDRVRVQSIFRRLSLSPQTDLRPTSHTHSGLPFNGLHPRNPCNCMEYYSFTDPGGMEGWVGLLGWPIADTLPTK